MDSLVYRVAPSSVQLLVLHTRSSSTYQVTHKQQSTKRWRSASCALANFYDDTVCLELLSFYFQLFLVLFWQFRMLIKIQNNVINIKYFRTPGMFLYYFATLLEKNYIRLFIELHHFMNNLINFYPGSSITTRLTFKLNFHFSTQKLLLRFWGCRDHYMRARTPQSVITVKGIRRTQFTFPQRHCGILNASG